jgi:NitT/TauT family transport system substrate-binding protein
VRGANVLSVAAAVLCTSLPAAAADRVVVSYDVRITSAELLIGVERGFFREQGIDLRLMPWNSSDQVLALLARGRIDVAAGTALGAAHVNLIQRGAGFRLVATRNVHLPGKCGYVSFVARRELVESGRLNEDPASVRGLRIALDRSSSHLYYWDRLLARAGLTLDDVVEVHMPNHVRLDAMARDLIDVTVNVEPMTYRMVSQGVGRVWLPVAEAVPDRQSSFLLFGPRFLGPRRDLAARFMTAYRRAVRTYLEEGKSERNVELVSRLTHMPREEVRELCWPDVSPDGAIDLEELRGFQRWALEQKLIDAVVPPEELVDLGFQNR